MVSESDIPKLIKDAVKVRREDIVQAKQFILNDGYSGTDGIVERWFQLLKLAQPDKLCYPSADFDESITKMGRGFSLRLAMYQAVWELITSGEVVATVVAKEWVPEIEYTFDNSWHSPTPLEDLKTHFMPEIYRLPLVESESRPADTDIFLESLNCKTIHPGILDAIEQALDCFRRGLYMPATVMLAAGVEAAWTECAKAVSMKLQNNKLVKLANDPLVGFGKIVSETEKVLEDCPAKSLLKDSGQSIAKIKEAVQWTTVLRERRNALHWGKRKGFIADHSSTASLLMAAPSHLGTLEAIRTK